MRFEYEHIRADRDKGIGEEMLIHFTTPDGSQLTVSTQSLIWAAVGLPFDATAEWVETTEDQQFIEYTTFHDREREGVVRPALAAYLRSIEEARITHDPQLVRDVNLITGWIESFTRPSLTSQSRKISEEVFDVENLERRIQAETADHHRLPDDEYLRVTGHPNYFDDNEYARLRRLGYTVSQIPLWVTLGPQYK